ncbi:guanyl-specific ribonuclease [Pseudonocardia phyllosphaerae]|uniref:ribonuclease domain-containing protein n=1 Tax=Pseudonocardia phyllosphaerae TaxID=3390502 RepID=UPI00397AD61C
MNVHSNDSSRRGPRALAVGLLVSLLTALGLALPTAALAAPATAATAVTTVPAAQSAPAAVPGQESGLPVVALSSLPPEATDTYKLIRSGGPFPYKQDNTTFSNREGILPKKPSGYYKEYTVKTPGSSDRGARRIVAGSGGEYYYTGDHYRSFSVVDTSK